MAEIGINKALPALALVCAAVAGFVVLKVQQAEGDERAVVEGGTLMRQAPALASTDADTTVDTIRSIGGKYEIVNVKLSKVVKQNERLMAERDELALSKEALADQHEKALIEQAEQQRQERQSEMQTLMDSLKSELHSLQRQVQSGRKPPVVMASPTLTIPAEFKAEDQTGYIWVEPLDEQFGVTRAPNLVSAPGVPSPRQGNFTQMVERVEEATQHMIRSGRSAHE